MMRLTSAGAFLVIAFFSTVTPADQPDFTGHRVVRVQVDNTQDLDVVLALTDDVWSHEYGVGGPIDVRVSPQQYEQLQATGLTQEVLIEDVQRLIDATVGGPLAGPYDAYMDLAQINQYVETTLINLDQHGIAQPLVYGTSIEGRPIKGLRITGPGGPDKPGVIYIACQHAREWISPPVAIYFAEQLIRGYNAGDAEIVALVDRAEFFIVPVVNPDGYSYTWTNNRLWRKNRRNNGGGSFGVDLNRNWARGWGGQGSSGDPNSDTYRGTGPFSEPESRAIADFITAHPNIVTFNDIHSYSQLILYPFGYKPDLPANQAEYQFVGRTMQQIIASVHGMHYEDGNIYTLLYPAAGDSGDWVHEDRGALALGYELRDTGQFGFVLPPDQILPTCEEIFPTLIFQAQWATAPLRIGFPNGLPAYVDPTGGTTLRIEVLPGTENVDPNGVRLHVRAAGDADFTAYAASFVGGNLFDATFPRVSCAGPVDYYVSATSTQGGVARSPLGAPAEFYSAAPGTLDVAFADDFQADRGWTVQNQNVSDGGWVRGVPAGNGGSRGDPPRDADGSGACYVTGNAANQDLDGGPTILTSPAIDMSDSSEYVVRYARWFTNDDGDDRLVVEVSNGGAWVQVESVGAFSGWVTRTFRVADYVAPSATVRVRFSASDNPNNSVTEAGIDAFEAFTVQCQSSQPGDMNCDGVLNSSDIEGFILALFDPAGYAQRYPDCDINLADMNGDGLINSGDIEGFIAALFGG